MNKKIIPVLVAVVCLLGAYAVYLFWSDKPTSTNDTSLQITDNIKNDYAAPADDMIVQETPKEEEKFTGILDMNKWHYNNKDGVYYQTGIYYAQSSLNSEYQKIAILRQRGSR